MELNEKVDRIVNLLGICPKCLSGFMEDNNDISQAVHMNDTLNKYKNLKCNSCAYSIRITNPHYISIEERQTKSFVHKTNSNDSLEEIMQDFSF